MATSPDVGIKRKRLGWVLGATVGVATSLFVFPSVVPWMIAGWLGYHTILVLRGRPGWIPLATCAIIVLVKNVDWPWALLLLAGITLAIGVWRGVRAWKRPDSATRRANFVSLAGVWAAWFAFTWTWMVDAQSSRAPELDANRPVVCIGDSLTSYGYPERLAELLAIPVLNLGIDGITSGDGVELLPKLIDANPQIVIIELGGHDFLQGHTRVETKANLQKIVDASQSIGAEVILMEIPRAFIVDPFGGLERELARENDLELIPDTAIRRLVLWSPFAPPGIWLGSDHYLSDDGLHPNARGNELMAEYVAEALVRLYGSQIRTGTMPE
jgi:lysophospholipase L1-like esterase